MSEMRSSVKVPERVRSTVMPVRTSTATDSSSLLRMLQKRLPWVATFIAGLLVGWLVLGGFLVPLPGLSAEPKDLTPTYQSLYLRFAADSYSLVDDAAFIQDALVGWEPRDLAEALAQAQAGTLDQGGQRRLATLRSLLGIPVGPTTLLDFMRRQGPIYVTLILSACMFVLAGAVATVPQIKEAIAAGSVSREAGVDGPVPDGVNVFAMNEGESLEDMLSSLSDRPKQVPPVVEKASTEAQAASTRPPHGPLPGSETEAAATETDVAPDAALDGAPGAAPAPSGGAAVEPRPGEAAVTESATGEAAAPTVPGGQKPGASVSAQKAADAAVQAGEGVGLDSPESFMAMLAGDGDSNSLQDLLADQVFSQIFNVEDLFDPLLRAMSESVNEIDLDELVRKCHLVNMQLQARHYLPELVAEDVLV